MTKVSPADVYRMGSFESASGTDLKLAGDASRDSGGTLQGLTRPSVHHYPLSLVVHPNRSSEQSDKGKRASARTSWVHSLQHHLKQASVRIGWHDSAAAQSLRHVIRGNAFSTLSMLALLFALFLQPVVVALQVPTNDVLDIVLTVVLAVFVVEFIGLLLVDTTYIFGFFFWMDIVGTASMLLDISFFFGTDATMPERLDMEGSTDSVVIVRAARAARIGARAGRLTRILKLLRFLPWIFYKLKPPEQGANETMARVMQNQLNSVLAKRVALLTIVVIVVIPVFNMFFHPESELSFSSWLEFLVKDVERSQAHPGDDSLRRRLTSELQRFSDFYLKLSYGPFRVCYGVGEGDDFTCEEDIPLSFEAWFDAPRRRSSIMEVRHGNLLAFFDLSIVKVHEAISSLVSIVFVILVMLGFGLIMSNSISATVLAPLERMLFTVRSHCKQVLVYVEGMQDDGDAASRNPDEDIEQEGEFWLLEHAISKLAAIAHLSAVDEQPKVAEDMTEDDIVKINWMQGTSMPATNSANLSVASKSTASRGRGSGLLRPPGTPSNGNHNGLSGTGDLSDSVPSSAVRPRCDSIGKEVFSLSTDGFDVLSWTESHRRSVAVYVIASSDGASEWSDAHSCMVNFVDAVEAAYLPNPYHNFAHGLDVLCTVWRFLHMISAQEWLSEASRYLLLIAAIGHDVGHGGLNNQFLVETSQDLAVKYNDWSPLEMMHCATLFHILKRPDCDVLPGDKALFKEMRKRIILSILHTDMKKHSDMIKELGLLYQLNSEQLENSASTAELMNNSEHNVQLMLNAMLHGSDVGNTMKPWKLAVQWADLCLEEFFAQGDQEKAVGIPVGPLNDRAKVNRPMSQVGFLEFAILPLAEAIVRVFPQLDEIVDHVGANMRNWSQEWKADANPPQQEIDKVDARVQKVQLRCKGLMRSRPSQCTSLVMGSAMGSEMGSEGRSSSHQPPDRTSWRRDSGHSQRSGSQGAASVGRSPPERA